MTEHWLRALASALGTVWLGAVWLGTARPGTSLVAIARAGALATALVLLAGSPAHAGEAPARSAGSADVAPVASADAANGTALPPPARADGVTLTVMNRSIVRLHATFFGMPPAERVEAARRRIEAALAAGGERRVSTRQVPQGTAITIDGAHMFAITVADVEQGLDESTEALARIAQRRLEQVVAEARESRDSRALLVATALAAGATVAYALVLWGLFHLRRSVRARFSGLIARHAEARHAEQVVRGEWMLELARAALRLAFWSVALLFTYEWLSFVLTRFPYTRPWGEELNGFLLAVAGTVVGGVVHAIPGVAIAVAIFVVARFVWGLFARFLDRVQSGSLKVSWLDAEFVRPARRIFVLVYWLFVVAMVYPYLPGSQSDAFKGISVLVGLMVSLGASNLVGQAASGIVIMFSRMYRPGDYIRVAENEGTVVEIGTFTTRLRTGMGEDLVMPNSLVLASVSRNFSRAVAGRGFIVNATVSIGYDAPWRQVEALLLAAAERTEGIVATPAPRVYQTNLADFYVEYRLSCHAVFAEAASRADVINRLNGNIQDAFNEAGVQIMSPHYFADPPEPKLVMPGRWFPGGAGTDAVTVKRVPSDSA